MIAPSTTTTASGPVQRPGPAGRIARIINRATCDLRRGVPAAEVAERLEGLAKYFTRLAKPTYHTTQGAQR